ncbi:MAG: GTP-binding protein, partial [Spirulinaceae cyanobacterium]
CKQGEISPEVLLGFNAAVEDDLENRPSHHDTEEDHEHDEEINSVQLILEQSFEPKALTSKLQTLVQAEEIYRVKGFVNVANKPMRLVLQGVGNRFDSFYDRAWEAQESRQTRLVLIGRNLDQGKIEQAILN